MAYIFNNFEAATNLSEVMLGFFSHVKSTET